MCLSAAAGRWEPISLGDWGEGSRA
jgi:hypothetical protein